MTRRMAIQSLTVRRRILAGVDARFPRISPCLDVGTREFVDEDVAEPMNADVDRALFILEPEDMPHGKEPLLFGRG